MTPKSGKAKGEKKQRKSISDVRERENLAIELSQRSLEFRKSYAEQRQPSRASANGPSRDQLLKELLDLVVPVFVDWCAIDVLDDSGTLQRLSAKHQDCTATSDSPHDANCCPSSLYQRAAQLDEVVVYVHVAGKSATWPPPTIDAKPWALVLPLKAKGRLVAVITFVVDDGQPGFSTLDIVVAEDVTQRVAGEIERSMLTHDARDAVRSTQRLASQLHQLIAVSLTVGGLLDESEIAKSLATSTRRVFDADAAVVSIENGPLADLAAVAYRGKLAALVDSIDFDVIDSLPKVRDGVTTPWRQGEWLVAPVLEGRALARGVVATRRSGGQFQTEDEEVLTLLAQMASTAFGSSALNRSIQRSETRWRILVETAPVGIIEASALGDVRWWNIAASKILSWPRYEPGAEGARPHFPDTAYHEFSTLREDALQGISTSRRDLIEVEINDRRHDLAASAVVLPDVENESRAVLLLIDDVTDLRQLKAEVRHAQQMELRGQVASSVAHDFNNLLTLISGYAEILAKDLREDEKSLEMVRDIQSTSSRASLLTAQLQAIGRTKSLEPVVLDPVAVLQSIAEVLERVVGTDVNIEWSLDTQPTHVRVDAGQFEQMIINLAINARDAMPDGGVVRIGVGIRASDAVPTESSVGDDPDYVAIVVTDTGVGMDEATSQRCFEPFFTTKGTFKGTGMGLAAARRLVEESGGSISCRSRPSEGTTFEILLPLVTNFIDVPVEPTPPAPPRGSATILLAEDDEALRQMMFQVLSRNGYTVVTAQSAEEALALSKTNGDVFDVLVSDVVMAEITGPELAATLQAEFPELRVLMTSGTADASVLSGLTAGTSSFLAKPFRPSQLIDEVHSLIARR